MEALEAMKQYFGYSDFRPGQAALMDGLLAGRDVVGVMPTGAGKSLCYQLPALLLDGVALVISPLIALMKDQVAALTRRGIPAAYLNSSLTFAQHRTVLARAEKGWYKILYVAPERLATEDFFRLVTRIPLSLVAVDEAHCVSQWGQDFRPSYLKIVDFLEQLPRRPQVGAFTATATDLVKEDMIRLLALRKPINVTTGFDRPNLSFAVTKPQDKSNYLRNFVARHPSKSGIIYCATRKAVEGVCGVLQRQGFAATRYHAGLSDQERQQNQEDFICDRARIMVATNAFGMGIDKANVSYVVHYNMPKNLESYYQEAGRAGRDGSPGECLLLFSNEDVQMAKFLIQNTNENEALTSDEREEVLRRDYERLNQMVGYCQTDGCLRRYLLGYFGEVSGDPSNNCGNCSNCTEDFDREDITVVAQKILSCVARVEKRFSCGLGVSLIAGILRGSRTQRIIEMGLDQIPTYGILSHIPQTQLRDYIELLIAGGYLSQTQGVYPFLGLGQRSSQVLFQGEKVWRKVKWESRDWEEGSPSQDLDAALRGVGKGHSIWKTQATEETRRQPKTLENVRRGVRWTDEEEEEIVSLYQDGRSIVEIAQQQGRSPGSIYAHLSKLGLVEEDIP